MIIPFDYLAGDFRLLNENFHSASFFLNSPFKSKLIYEEWFSLNINCPTQHCGKKDVTYEIFTKGHICYEYSEIESLKITSVASNAINVIMSGFNSI